MTDLNSLSGPSLDALVDEVREWYVEMRAFGIKALTGDSYPYGSIPITPEEQYQKFLSMQPTDWAQMRAILANIHRGEPDMVEAVEKDIENYIHIQESYGRRQLNA